MAALARWFWSAMEWLGVWAPKNAKILVLGLDNAGKTTLMRYLATGAVTSNPPTGMPYSNELELPNSVRVKAFDMGGQVAARRIWKKYLATADGVVYMVDSSDVERLAESRKELQALLTAEELATMPIVVMGNKIDRVGAVSEGSLRVELGLTHTFGKTVNKKDVAGSHVRPVELFMCSIVARAGVRDGIEWFGKMLAARA